MNGFFTLTLLALSQAPVSSATIDSTPCCSTCKEGTAKYWANDKPNKQCAETCVSPSDKLRLAELWVLTGGQGKFTNESAPCAKDGFHTYNRTDKLGAGPITVFLDKYDPDHLASINSAPCCSTCKEGTAKFWANDKPNKQCAETCISPTDKLKLAEYWVLTGGQGLMTKESAPCAKAGFHKYNRTDKLGAGPLTLFLDKYDPDHYDEAVIV